jgi:crossover junction endonuclease MUS81
VNSKKKKEYGYIPSYRSGSWAILMAMHEAVHVEKFTGSLFKPAIVSRAIKYSDTSFSDEVTSIYNAWSSITTLIEHILVSKEGNPVYYELTEQGSKLASLLYDSFTSMRIEKYKVPSIGVSFDSEEQEIILIVDNREIKKGENNNIYSALKSRNIKCERRNLSLGDISWVAKNKITNQEFMVDIIVERKKTPDLAASISDGRYKEQKFRLERCGLSRVIYLIEVVSIIYYP